MRHLTTTLLLMLAGFLSSAQITFQASDLPDQPGQYQRAYFSTNVNIAAFTIQTTVPQHWDMSAPQQPNEIIQRTEIVSIEDGGNAGSFPGATYAERDTDEPDTQIAWRYYSLTNQGRLYHGFFNPVNNPVSPLVVFDQPTLDVPSPMQFGQSWNRAVAWTNIVLLFPIAYHFTASAEVDGYGTIGLRGFGDVPALRVREIHVQKAYISGEPEPFVSQTNTYIFWLAQGMGNVAQIISFGENSADTATNVFLRVFSNESRITSATNLVLKLQTNSTVLNWNQDTNAWGYRVETIENLNATNWQALDEPATNFWTTPLLDTEPHRFFRVFSKP